MRKLVVGTFLTLDGVMQAPGGPDEDTSGGFRYGGWTAPFWDDELGATEMGALLAGGYDLLLGRRTYDIFAGYWPGRTDDVGRVFNPARKWVVSRSLEHAGWENSVVLRDAERDVAALRRSEGPDLWVVGSGDLVQSLLQHDLVDRLQVWTFPVLLGTGKRLFGDGTQPVGLRLVGQPTIANTGVVIATYERAGEVRVGSFA